MITIIYSTHKNQEYNSKFKTHLINSVGLNDVQILEYQNNNEYSLAEIYNKGISESKFDIVVCCHNDIKLEKNWGKKLIEDFQNNPEFGIIGKAGSCYFPESGIYWERMNQTMVGQVWHHPEEKNKWINNYSPKLPFLIPVVTIDGLFISFDKKKILHKFDETIGKFHFYDHGFTIPNYLNGVKIGVTSSFEITHQSIGQPNQEFFESKEKFLEKYKQILPLDLKPRYLFDNIVPIKEIKIKGKVAVIILNKGNLDLLFQCIESFYEYCDKEIFDIFIADTGSSVEEIELIEELISKVGNIKLIKYNFYNFAKINNDVVKYHIDKHYEYLLFCNNDIKLQNDVISGMLNVYKTKSKVGTIGCRLHYEDNTIQHDGIEVYIQMSTKQTFVTHKRKNSYYNFTKDVSSCIGNTAALMMINKNTFIQIGMFNENYNECYEDVELNLSLAIKGFENYLLGTHSAYHYESKTRDIENNQSIISYDLEYVLIPFIKKNMQKLMSKILFLK